jgi:hypothetical protein
MAPFNDFLPMDDARRRLQAIRELIIEFQNKDDGWNGFQTTFKDSSLISELEMVQWLIRYFRVMESELQDAQAKQDAAEIRAAAAESALESATQPLEPEMARLNKRVIELTELLDLQALGFKSNVHYEQWTKFAQQVAHVGHKASLHAMPMTVLQEELAKLTATAFNLLTNKVL